MCIIHVLGGLGLGEAEKCGSRFLAGLEEGAPQDGTLTQGGSELSPQAGREGRGRMAHSSCLLSVGNEGV